MGLFDRKLPIPKKEVPAPVKVENNVIDVETKEEEEVYYKERVQFAKYQRKYLNDKNKKTNKAILILLLISIGVICLALLSQIAYNIYSINQYAGIGVAIALLVFFLIFYIICISYIVSRPSFHNIYDEKTNTRKKSVRHNNKVRTELAIHLINMYENTGVLRDNKLEYEPAVNDIVNKLYGGVKGKRVIKIDDSPEKLELLATDYLNNTNTGKVKLNHDRLIKNLELEFSMNNLKYEIYTSNQIHQASIAKCLQSYMKRGGAIHKEAQKMIRIKAVECGLSSAISQSKAIDASVVALMNMQLITDLVYLYGFRPNDMQMNRIMFGVIRNVGLAIGLNDLNVGGSIINRIVPKGTGNAIVSFFSNLIDSAIQLVVNGTLTIIVGEQTVDYLLEEYEMQEILRVTDKDKEEYYLDVTDLRKNIQTDILKKKTQLATD